MDENNKKSPCDGVIFLIRNLIATKSYGSNQHFTTQSIKGEIIMNWNLFWSLYIFAFSVPIWIIFYFLGIRKLNKGKRCTEHTVGIVKGLSAIRCGDVPLPLIQYEVDGKTYKVTGPMFKSASYISVSTPFQPIEAMIESNLTTREDLPLSLVIKSHTNSFARAETTPLFKLYPIGSEADVYYNPKKPKESYVQRYIPASIGVAVLLGVIAISMTAFGVLLLLGPEIVMQ